MSNRIFITQTLLVGERVRIENESYDGIMNPVVHLVGKDNTGREDHCYTVCGRDKFTTYVEPTQDEATCLQCVAGISHGAGRPG